MAPNTSNPHLPDKHWLSVDHAFPPAAAPAPSPPAGQPRGYKVRLYVLQALNLTPMDLGIGGRPGKSDPYLRVKLGKEVSGIVTR